MTNPNLANPIFFWKFRLGEQTYDYQKLFEEDISIYLLNIFVTAVQK